MASGNGGIPILTGYQQPLDQLREPSSAGSRPAPRTTPSTSSTSPSATSRRKTDALAAKQEEVTAQRVRYEQLAAEANAQVEHLQQVEQQRLADEQVRLALEAQRREEQRRLAEQQAAEAAQRQPRRPSGPPPSSEAAARQAEQDQAAQATANQAAAAGGQRRRPGPRAERVAARR